MSADSGTVTTEVDGAVFVITVDRVAKRNAFTPEMFDGLARAMEELDRNPALWVGVIAFAGDHTTAGLDLPKFFGPGASGNSRGEGGDAFALRRRCRKPVVMAVQGIAIGIEMMLGADIVVAAADCRFRQLEHGGSGCPCAARRLGQRHVSPAARG